MTFGDYLRELREARKLNKNKFAQALGIPFSTVNAWELHGATPNKKSLTAIIDVLALPPGEKKKLTESWLQIPGRGGKRPAPSPPDDQPERADASRKELEALLTLALVPGRHTLSDGVAVLAALGEAALFIKELSTTRAQALAWMDAAVLLRKRGQRVTPALLAAAMAHADVEHPERSLPEPDESGEVRRDMLPGWPKHGPQKKDPTSD